MNQITARILILSSLLLGLGAGGLWSMPMVWLSCSAALIFTLALISYRAAASVPLLVFLCLFVMALGLWRAGSLHLTPAMANLWGGRVTGFGLIVREVEEHNGMQRLVIKLQDVPGLIQASVPKGTHYQYADKVYVAGQLTQPAAYPDFNYPRYLQARGILGLMYRPQVLILAGGQGNWLVSGVLAAKAWFTEKITNRVDLPASGLLLGMLLGSRNNLPAETESLFEQLGLTHVLAVSGYNVGLMVVVVEWLALVLGRRTAAVAGMFLVLLFGLLAGLSASVLRAVIMSVLLLLAWVLARLYTAGPAILAAACLMVWLQPAVLWWDVGFQLSFIATLGIVFGAPYLSDKLAGFLPHSIAQALGVTLAAYISTAPVLALQFGSLSLIAPVANALYLPFVPILMLLGFLSAFPLVGFGASYFAESLLGWLLAVLAMFANLPFAAVSVKISHWQFWCILGLVAVIAVLIKRPAFGQDKLGFWQKIW